MNFAGHPTTTINNLETSQIFHFQNPPRLFLLIFVPFQKICNSAHFRAFEKEEVVSEGY